jgi:hypothetical protein
MAAVTDCHCGFHLQAQDPVPLLVQIDCIAARIVCYVECTSFAQKGICNTTASIGHCGEFATGVADSSDGAPL